MKMNNNNNNNFDIVAAKLSIFMSHQYGITTYDNLILIKELIKYKNLKIEREYEINTLHPLVSFSFHYLMLVASKLMNSLFMSKVTENTNIIYYSFSVILFSFFYILYQI